MSERYKRRIIVVDDSEDVLDMVAAYLSKSHFDVVCRKNPYAIDRLVSEYEPHAVVLDVTMPTVRGDRLARLFSNIAPELPIIFYSSIDLVEGRRLAADFRGATFVSKSDGVRALRDTLQRILGLEPPAEKQS